MKRTQEQVYLQQKREERIQALKGKWVITQESHYNKNQILYLQDRNLAKSYGYQEMTWTKFLANARGFENEFIARSIARRFKYGNVKVMEVQ